MAGQLAPESHRPPAKHPTKSLWALGPSPGGAPQQMQGCWRPPPRCSWGHESTSTPGRDGASEPPAAGRPGFTGGTCLSPSASSRARQRESDTPKRKRWSWEQRHIYCRTVRGERRLTPPSPSSGRGSAKHERPGEAGAGLIVADSSVSESLVLAAVHIGEVPVSLQTSHMTDDILCHECCLLSLCEWKCSPFKVGALRMGSASGSAQHS